MERAEGRVYTSAVSRTALRLMVTLLVSACLPDARPADAGSDRDGGTVLDGGDAGEEDAGVFCDPVPAQACVASGRYGSRLDGGVFDYRGPCAPNNLASTLGGGCCERMTTSCTFTGGYVCTMPGNQAGSAPCCFDLCDGGEPCDCRRSGSCACGGSSCAPTVASYLCPLIGVSGP